MKKITIRVDGNEIIASGHVMRCLSIAGQCRKLGMEVTFLVADDRPAGLIKEKGFAVDVLGTVWDDLEQETEKICSYVQTHEVSLLLLDTYYVTQSYLATLSKNAHVVYIDDLNRFAYPVQTLINYGAFVEQREYEKTYEAAGVQPDFLLGSRYIPLREEFHHQPYQIRDKVTNVLITTGGTDRLNVAGNLLEAIIQNPALAKLTYHVIVGYFNQNKEVLYSLAARYPWIVLHENVTDMSHWMRFCDVAVSAAGTTVCELCACGIPSVCLEIADNQQGADRWEKAGYLFYAGNAAEDMEGCMQKCVESIEKYMQSDTLREERSHRMQSLVDGCGAERIAQYLRNSIVL